MNTIPQVKNRNGSHKYATIRYDIEGWAKTSDATPEDFDLCYLRNVEGNIKIGWRSGNHWDGLNVDYDEAFCNWKRKKD